jgi:hypothetical protein
MTDELPNAIFLRLKNGDDIISDMVELEEDGEEHYLLLNPLKVVYMPSDDKGLLQIAFMTWVFPKICSNQEFTISKEDVIMLSMVSDGMNEYYWSSVEQIEKRVSDSLSLGESATDEEMEALDEIMDELNRLDVKRTFH